jgi:adhesin transport system membrane fusion protein
MDKELVVEARISPVDIGHITLGHKANVRITTFDFARLGAIEGTVTKISASTFKDRENEVYYKVEIKLKDAYVGDESSETGFHPGWGPKLILIPGGGRCFVIFSTRSSSLWT